MIIFIENSIEKWRWRATKGEGSCFLKHRFVSTKTQKLPRSQESRKSELNQKYSLKPK